MHIVNKKFDEVLRHINDLIDWLNKEKALNDA